MLYNYLRNELHLITQKKNYRVYKAMHLLLSFRICYNHMQIREHYQKSLLIKNNTDQILIFVTFFKISLFYLNEISIFFCWLSVYIYYITFFSHITALCIRKMISGMKFHRPKLLFDVH